MQNLQPCLHLPCRELGPGVRVYLLGDVLNGQALGVARGERLGDSRLEQRQPRATRDLCGTGKDFLIHFPLHIVEASLIIEVDIVPIIEA